MYNPRYSLRINITSSGIDMWETTKNGTCLLDECALKISPNKLKVIKSGIFKNVENYLYKHRSITVE